jgi:hypothetical protein
MKTLISLALMASMAMAQTNQQAIGIEPWVPTNDWVRHVTVGWDAPTENEDGSPLTDLAGYRVYWGETSATYTVVSDLIVETTDTVSITNRNDAYLAVTALDTSGNESDFSEELHWVGNVPARPMNLRIEPVALGLEITVNDIPPDAERVDVQISQDLETWLRKARIVFYRAEMLPPTIPGG